MPQPTQPGDKTKKKMLQETPADGATLYAKRLRSRKNKLDKTSRRGFIPPWGRGNTPFKEAWKLLVREKSQKVCAMRDKGHSSFRETEKIESSLRSGAKR